MQMLKYIRGITKSEYLFLIAFEFIDKGFHIFARRLPLLQCLFRIWVKAAFLMIDHRLCLRRLLHAVFEVLLGPPLFSLDLPLQVSLHLVVSQPLVFFLLVLGDVQLFTAQFPEVAELTLLLLLCLQDVLLLLYLLCARLLNLFL